MTQSAQPEPNPIGASFAAHLTAFHRSLPPEEQKLLEEILALADRGMAEEDTGGYAAFFRLGGVGEVKGQGGSGPADFELPVSFLRLVR